MFSVNSKHVLGNVVNKIYIKGNQRIESSTILSYLNIKNSYRSLNAIDKKIINYAEKLPVLEDDTKNIMEYVEQSNNKKKKKFNFWKLLETNE